MKTLRSFISEFNIQAESEWADENPNMTGDTKWQANHYKVTLKGNFAGQRRQLTTYFSMGMAHTNEPTAEDVLDCLACDSSSIDNTRNFEEWAQDLGFDTDSRTAEKTYRICQRQNEKLRQFLGSHYKTLVYNTERQ